jgi:hypothetical protein
MVGLFYRVSTTLFFLGFTYIFLLDKTNYLNHFYLISLISLIMIFVPAHRAFSLDALLRPKIRSGSAPTWSLWLLRAQLGIAYFYGGIAKLNGDWLHGVPMRMWLAERTDFPLIGHLFSEEWAAYVFSYGGLLFDLLFVPFVLWRRTRFLALGVALVFHLMNSRLFSIGIFPWFMIAANLLFLNPGWPRTIFRWGRMVDGQPANPRLDLGRRQRIAIAILGVYLAVQIFLPLRHHLYPGDVHWTEEGHYFSWRMKLRDKTGQAQFFVTDPVSQSSWEVDPFTYVTKRQYGEMIGQPDMILQLAQHIARSLREQGHVQIEVRAWVGVSLNGRHPQVLVDPAVDLAAQPRSLLAANWIVPLTEPLTVSKRSPEKRTEDESDN